MLYPLNRFECRSVRPSVRWHERVFASCAVSIAITCGEIFTCKLHLTSRYFLTYCTLEERRVGGVWKVLVCTSLDKVSIVGLNLWSRVSRSSCKVRTPHRYYLYECVRNGKRSGVKICGVQPVTALSCVRLFVRPSALRFRALTWVVYNYETGSMTGILGQLKWESPKKRRKDDRLILLYKGLKGKASVPTDDLIPKTRRCRNQHSMAFQTPIANTDVYKGSFFPQTIRDWNALPDSLISSAEDAEDCVSKFTSLVRARD